MLNSGKSVTVAGGSLSGLFAGALLRLDGWEVNIYERSPNELESRGGGIVLQPEVVEIFRRLGLDPDGPIGVWADERVFLDHAGNVIERLRMRQKQTSWNAIYQAVKDTFPPEFYHRGRTFRSLRQRPDAVVAMIDDCEVQSDLLIGADGGRSAVRASIATGATSTYAGYVAFRGLVPESDLSAEDSEILRDRFSFFQYPGSQFLSYLVAGEGLSIDVGHRRFNWVWYRNVDADLELAKVLTDRNGNIREYGVAPGMLSDAVHDDLIVAADVELPPPMRALVLATKEPFVQAIVDLEVARMVDGRVALVGDAAFVPRPHTAASTSKAAANILALVDVLKTEGNVASALKNWEPTQLALGRYLRRRGQMLGDRSQFPNR